MLTVKEINDESEFADLKTTWNDLLKQSSSDTPFLTWQWLYSWWKVYGEQSRLMILALQEDQELVALAPLMTRIRSLGFLKVKEIVFLGSFGVGSDYLDFIIVKGSENASIDMIFSHLTKNEHKWDVICLTNILETSESIDHLKEACKELGYFNIESASVVCPSIQLPSTWDEYISTLSKSMRSDIRRKNSKLCRSADIEYEVIRENGDLKAAMNDFIQLNRLRMKTKNIHGAFRDSKFMQFHKNLISTFFQEDLLHLSFLKANNTRIAALYNFIYNDTCFYYQSGFDLAWARFSPGTVLFSFSIRDAIENGMREYDFLQGDEAYKFKWTNMKRQCVSIFVYNKTLVGLLLYYSFLIKSYLKKLLRRPS